MHMHTCTYTARVQIPYTLEKPWYNYYIHMHTHACTHTHTHTVRTCTCMYTNSSDLKTFCTHVHSCVFAFPPGCVPICWGSKPGASRMGFTEANTASVLSCLVLNSNRSSRNLFDVHVHIGLRPMWRFHSYFEPVGKARGIKRAVKLTIEGVNVFRLVVSRLYKDPHYFKPSLRSQTSKVIIHSCV